MLKHVYSSVDIAEFVVIIFFIVPHLWCEGMLRNFSQSPFVYFYICSCLRFMLLMFFCLLFVYSFLFLFTHCDVPVSMSCRRHCRYLS